MVGSEGFSHFTMRPHSQKNAKIQKFLVGPYKKKKICDKEKKRMKDARFELARTYAQQILSLPP